MKRIRSKSLRRSGRPRSALTTTLIVIEVVGLVLPLAIAWSTGRSLVAAIVFLGFVLLGIGLAVGQVWERSRWDDPVKSLARNLAAFNDQPNESWDLPGTPTLAELIAPLRDLQVRYLSLKNRLELDGNDALGSSDSGEMRTLGPLDGRMTRSGSYEAPMVEDPTLASSEFPTLEMISRLDPKTLRWLDSSLTEQLFLGWSLAELKEKSFLDIVQSDDRRLAKQQLRRVLERGEGHGLIYRITTAKGETRAVEMNIGVRYAVDQKVLHLRCHLTDVTAKLRDESELRRRTLELTQANDELRRTNRELEELKDRYSDLYENAPAMYFTVDRLGQFLECNNTLVRTLGFTRRELLGRPVARLLPIGRSPTPADLFTEPRPGSIEFESEWTKLDGATIAVWVTGTAIPGADGKVRHVRCVAQDITARRTLEAELQVKNERLALANTELSRKNKELDEFTYVVSHDLQEPLRTLIAFSDFLMRDRGDKLDDVGKEYVRYLVEASRRLRALIQDLLSLSRAGKVTAEFSNVNLEEVVDVLKVDLSELVRSRNAEILVERPLPKVWGDRDRIAQLLANLVGNGLKYNQGPDPIVEISATEDEAGRWVTLSVKDNGIGIDPQFHAKIFQLFRRLHTREEYEGTGAGLAICQKIVQAHGGRIWVESKPGQGSTFHVTLPGSSQGTSSRRAEILHAS